MSIYRKIYQQHFGAIPKDSNGRSMEIHHINGDHNDNRIENLKLVTIDEHYDIHLQQGNYVACLKMLRRMSLSEDERFKIQSEISKKSNAERIANGTHPFLSSNFQKKHALKRIQEGRHHFIGDSNPVYKQIKSGTNLFLNSEWQKNKGKKTSASMSLKYKNGTHPSQIRETCPHCGKTFSKPNITRWHGDRCKSVVLVQQSSK